MCSHGPDGTVHSFLAEIEKDWWGEEDDQQMDKSDLR